MKEAMSSSGRVPASILTCFVFHRACIERVENQDRRTRNSGPSPMDPPAFDLEFG
jgi:hypothetical protein